MSAEIYKYTGAVHIHSVHSDGTSDIKSIARAARSAGLSWIIITDHNYIDEEEGVIEGVTVIKGEEISPESDNHYLAIGINKCIPPSDDIQETINAVRQEGGFGFAAHPDESLTRENPHKPIRWPDKSIMPDGIEIWNWFSSWADSYNSKNIFTKMHAYFFKDRLVKRPCRETLRLLDFLNKSTDKIIPAIGGVDAHALKIKGYIIPVTVFPYEEMFKTIANEIFLYEPLSDDFQTRKRQIIDALKAGRNIIFNRTICGQAPEIYIKNSSDRAFSGESLRLDFNTFLYFNCRRKAEITIYKDTGEYVKLKAERAEIRITQPGKYRLEAEIKGFGFAYSNFINVLPPIKAESGAANGSLYGSRTE